MNNTIYLEEMLRKHLQQGTVIPAHPLALNKDLSMDEDRHRRLTRYYMASGAGGIATAVHSTQFEIRLPEINLFEKVLETTAEEVDKAALARPFLKIAGICGPTYQAAMEAEVAAGYGYHLALLSMGGLSNYSERQLLERVEVIAGIMPVFGFYLQPAVGGRVLSYDFWKAFAEIKNVMAIKVAAFNRYQTLDVVRAVMNSSRCNEIALYTGNDDNIIADLLTPYRFTINDTEQEKRFVGGLLGQWAVWTSKAVELLDEVKACIQNNYAGADKLLAKNIQLTDVNAAIFDPANNFHGCIPGIHEVLRRQGLLEGRYCLNPKEELSPGQMENISRICQQYPCMNDDAFVRSFLS